MTFPYGCVYGGLRLKEEIKMIQNKQNVLKLYSCLLEKTVDGTEHMNVNETKTSRQSIPIGK